MRKPHYSKLWDKIQLTHAHVAWEVYEEVSLVLLQEGKNPDDATSEQIHTIFEMSVAK